MEELLTQLTQLKLARIREAYRDWIDKESREEMSYSDFLRGLISEEICASSFSACMIFSTLSRESPYKVFSFTPLVIAPLLE